MEWRLTGEDGHLKLVTMKARKVDHFLCLHYWALRENLPVELFNLMAAYLQ